MELLPVNLEGASTTLDLVSVQFWIRFPDFSQSTSKPQIKVMSFQTQERAPAQVYAEGIATRLLGRSHLQLHCPALVTVPSDWLDACPTAVDQLVTGDTTIVSIAGGKPADR